MEISSFFFFLWANSFCIHKWPEVFHKWPEVTGSLGPLVFMSPPCVLEFILFADDTNIFFSHNDPNFLIELVNTELQKLSCWFQANKLSINVKK